MSDPTGGKARKYSAFADDDASTKGSSARGSSARALFSAGQGSHREAREECRVSYTVEQQLSDPRSSLMSRNYREFLQAHHDLRVLSSWRRPSTDSQDFPTSPTLPEPKEPALTEAALARVASSAPQVAIFETSDSSSDGDLDNEQDECFYS